MASKDGAPYPAPVKETPKPVKTGKKAAPVVEEGTDNAGNS